MYFNAVKFCVAGAVVAFSAAGAVCSAGAAGETVETVDDAPALQAASAGKIDRHYIYSPQLQERVTVDVWLPGGYDPSREKGYPVVYMHDGQNLFDASTSWNNQSWEMDSVTDRLIGDGEIEPAVIVGVHSVAATRKGDLMPEKALEYITSLPDSSLKEFLDRKSVRGDAYAAFLVETLKPAMDSLYRLSPDLCHTSLMGSSMGGLMSVYAMSEYPEVFGSAACLSTHWVGTLDCNPAFPSAMLGYLADHLPRDGRHRLYLDHGTTSLDSLYGPWEEKVISLVDSLGYNPGAVCCGRPRFESYVAQGAGHEERYWRDRVEKPLRFLLGHCGSRHCSE